MLLIFTETNAGVSSNLGIVVTLVGEMLVFFIVMLSAASGKSGKQQIHRQTIHSLGGAVHEGAVFPFPH